MDEQKSRYTFGNDEFSLEDAYHDCKLVFDGITDDDSFQKADTGLILYYANEIIYALHEALQGKDTDVLSNDCISRQAALDEKNIVHIEMFGRDLPVVPVATLKGLPPAQSECKDAVSRADVDLLIEEAQTAWLKGDILLMYPVLKKGLQKVPPVTPKRKNGRWIYGENDGQDGWYCSECGGFVPWDYDYYGLDNIDFIKDFKTCPRCDARMISYTGMEEGEQE